MKKTLSFILAVVMIMAVVVPAFASDPSPKPNSIEVESSVSTPTIDFTLPSPEAITLNPYGLGSSEADKVQIQQDAMFFENKSDVAVKVSLTATGVLPATNTDKVAFATTTTVPATGKAPATTKSIFLYVDVQENADGTTATDIAAYDSKSTSQIVVKAGDTKKDVAILDDKDTTTGKKFAQIRIGGDMVAAPAVAWTANDAVKVKLVFDLTATVRPATTTP